MKYDIERLIELQDNITSINEELSKYGLDQEKLNKVIDACVLIEKCADLKGFVDAKFDILGVGEVPGRNTISLPKELSEEVKKVVINYCEKEIDRLNKVVEGKKYTAVGELFPGEYAGK